MGYLQLDHHHNKMRLLLSGLVLCLATAGWAFPRKQIPEELVEKTASVKDDKAPLIIKDDKEEVILEDEENASQLKVDKNEKTSITIDDDDEVRDDVPEENPITFDDGKEE